MTRVAQVPAELFEVDETMDRGAVKAAPEDFSDPAADPSEDTFDRANRTRILDPNDALLAEAGAKKPVRGPAIVRRVPNTHRAPSAQSSRHALSSRHRAQNATSVTNSAPHVAVIAQ